MKLVKIIISVTLSVIILAIVAIQGYAEVIQVDLDNNRNININESEVLSLVDEKLIPCSAKLSDEFADNSVLVVMKNRSRYAACCGF